MTLVRKRLFYRARVALPGATDVSTGVDFILPGHLLSAVPRVSGQSVDVVEGHTESRPSSLRIIDANAALTSHLANAQGEMHLLGRLVDLQESEDKTNWTTVQVGRLSDLSETDPGEWVLQISDERWLERNSEIFTTTHTTQVWPSGLKETWKGFKPTGLKSYIAWGFDEIDPSTSTWNAPYTIMGFVVASGKDLSFSSSVISFLNSDLVEFPVPRQVNGTGNFKNLRAQIRGYAYEVVGFGKWGEEDILHGVSTYDSSADEDDRDDTDIIWIVVPDTHPRPQLADAVSLHAPTAEPSEVLPYHVGMAGDRYGTPTGSIHPFELCRRIYEDIGVRFDNAALQALIDDDSYPEIAIRVTSKQKAFEFLEENIYKPFGVVPFINNNGEISPKSVRLPQNLNTDALFSFNNSNLAEEGHPTFEHTSRDVVNSIRFHYQSLISRFGRIDPEASPFSARASRDWWADGLMGRDAHHDVDISEGQSSSVFGKNRLEVELHGVDAGGWSNLGAYFTDFVQPLAPTLESLFNKITPEVFNRFKDGPIRGSFTGLLSTDVVEPGDFVLLENTTLPNPAINARGGGRIVQIVSKDRSVTGPTFSFIDVGPSLQPLPAPTLTLRTVDEETIEYTIGGIPAGGQAQVEVGFGDVAPAQYPRKQTRDADGVYTVSPLPSETTAFFRARVLAPGRSSSIWTYAQIATSVKPRVYDVRVVLNDNDAPVVSWENGRSARGMRVRYVVHAPVEGLEDVVFTAATDVVATDKEIVLPVTVALGEEVTVEVEPWSAWDAVAASVGGVAGDAVQASTSPALTLKIVQQEVHDVRTELNALDTYIDGAFHDSIITEAEARAIARHINDLNTEKEDVDRQYAVIYGNTLLQGTAKTNLADAKLGVLNATTGVREGGYDQAHQELIDTINNAIADGKATAAEAAAVDVEFADYSAALGLLAQRMQEAIDAISAQRALRMEYASDANGTNASSTFDPAIHTYARHSDDGGQTWTAWYRIVGEEGEPGTDGTFVEYLFAVGTTAPSLVNTDPNPVGWSDTPPAYDPSLGERLWMTKARKNVDGTLVSRETWTPPVQISGPEGPPGVSIETRYSGPTAGSNIAATFDPAVHVYMQTRKEGEAWPTTWARIVGEKGDVGPEGVFTDYRFGKGATAPAVSATTPDPGASWTDAPPTYDAEGGEFLWMIEARKNADGTLVTNWSTPVALSGPKGPAGTAAAAISVSEGEVSGKNHPLTFTVAPTEASFTLTVNGATPAVGEVTNPSPGVYKYTAVRQQHIDIRLIATASQPGLFASSTTYTIDRDPDPGVVDFRVELDGTKEVRLYASIDDDTKRLRFRQAGSSTYQPSSSGYDTTSAKTVRHSLNLAAGVVQTWVAEVTKDSTGTTGWRTHPIEVTAHGPTMQTPTGTARIVYPGATINVASGRDPESLILIVDDSTDPLRTTARGFYWRVSKDGFPTADWTQATFQAMPAGDDPRSVVDLGPRPLDESLYATVMFHSESTAVPLGEVPNGESTTAVYGSAAGASALNVSSDTDPAAPASSLSFYGANIVNAGGTATIDFDTRYVQQGAASGSIAVQDIRDTTPAPNAIGSNRTVTSQFNNAWAGMGNSWRSALTVRGWTENYATWQLVGPSTTSADNDLYFRSGVGAAWGTPQKVAFRIGKTLRVASDGTGDYTTIQAAINAAVAGGAASGSANSWLIEVVRGSYTENINVPPGIFIRGSGIKATYIVGNVTMDYGTALSDLNVYNTTTAPAVTVNLTANSSGVSLDTVYVLSYGAVDAPRECVRVTGTAAQLVSVQNCYLYCHNSSAGASAQAVIFRILSGAAGFIECFSTHAKTAAGGGGREVFAWVQSSGAGSYVHAGSTDWMPAYAANPVLLDNENTVVGRNAAGAFLDVSVAAGLPTIEDVVAENNKALHSKIFNNLYADDWFRNRRSGRGLYNEGTGTKLYAQDVNYWRTTSRMGLVVADDSDTPQGYIFHNSAGFGLLHSGAGWALRTTPTSAELWGTVTTHGQLIVRSFNDAILTLRQTNTGGVAGTSDPGWNYIQFEDEQGDRQGYTGFDSSGVYRIYNQIGGFIDLQSAGAIRLQTAAYTHANSKQIKYLADPTDAMDATNMGWVTNKIADVASSKTTYSDLWMNMIVHGCRVSAATQGVTVSTGYMYVPESGSRSARRSRVDATQLTATVADTWHAVYVDTVEPDAVNEEYVAHIVAVPVTGTLEYVERAIALFRWNSVANTVDVVQDRAMDGVTHGAYTFRDPYTAKLYAYVDPANYTDRKLVYVANDQAFVPVVAGLDLGTITGEAGGQRWDYVYARHGDFSDTLKVGGNNVATDANGYADIKEAMGLARLTDNAPYIRHTNAHGYIDIGPGNAGWAHLITDRPGFYLNKALHVNADIRIYNTSYGIYQSGAAILNSVEAYGDILVQKNNPWLTLDSNSTGLDGVEQGAGISIGESGYKGGAALHLTYTGNGWGNIGMGSVDTTTGVMANRAMRLNYNDSHVRFDGNLYVAGLIYDSNDQTYYLNPAGTSFFNELRVRFLYDMDDTAFYLNPAGTTNLNSLSTKTLSLGGDLNITYSNINFNLPVGITGGWARGAVWKVGGTNNFGVGLYGTGDGVTTTVHYGYIGYGTGPWSTTHLRLYPDGTVLASSHVNFEGNLFLTGGGRIEAIDNGAWSGEPPSGRGKIEYHAGRWYTVSSGTTGSIFIARNGSAQNVFEVDADGTVTSKGGGSFAASLFASSEMYVGNWLRLANNGGGYGIYWQNGYGAGWQIKPTAAASTPDMIIRSGTGANSSLAFTTGDDTPRGYIHWTTANEIGFLSATRGWSLKMDAAGAARFYGPIYAGIMYDSNDPTYYMNPGGTSKLMGIIDQHNNPFKPIIVSASNPPTGAVSGYTEGTVWIKV